MEKMKKGRNSIDAMSDGVLVNALKGWTGKANANVVYDSTVDEFTADGLFNKVKGKRNIALVAFTADGDVFGGFYSVAVTEDQKFFHDPNIFVFSFESHGRCVTPQRFVVRVSVRSSKCVLFWRSYSNVWFVNVGGNNGYLLLGNEKTNTKCCHLSSGFVGIENTTLTGKPNCERFTCTRIVAVHLQ